MDEFEVYRARSYSAGTSWKEQESVSLPSSPVINRPAFCRPTSKSVYDKHGRPPRTLVREDSDLSRKLAQMRLRDLQYSSGSPVLEAQYSGCDADDEQSVDNVFIACRPQNLRVGSHKTLASAPWVPHSPSPGTSSPGVLDTQKYFVNTYHSRSLSWQARAKRPNDLDLGPEEWQIIYTRAYKLTKDTKIIAFNFKITHRILACGYQLEKWQINEDN